MKGRVYSPQVGDKVNANACAEIGNSPKTGFLSALGRSRANRDAISTLFG
jgi:hypothetical protein